MVDIHRHDEEGAGHAGQLQEAQEELAQLEVEGQSGGGMVRVTLTGKGEMKAIAIDPSLLTPDDKEMVEDLILAAYADAQRQGRSRRRPRRCRASPPACRCRPA